MNIHEYQAKEFFSRYGVAVPKGIVADTPDGVVDALDKLGGKGVVKAQVHAGGRGKAGGVRLVDNAADAREVAQKLLGKRLVTKQTGAEGVPVNSLLVEEQIGIANELYLSILVDGDKGVPEVVASQHGGMDIEQVAEEQPEEIFYALADPLLGLLPYKIRDVGIKLGLSKTQLRSLGGMVSGLYRAFVENDCSLIEINPLVITNDGGLLAADGKVVFEDDALYRHPDIAKLFDEQQEEELELRARSANLAYVKLDSGSVGCMVNGAGLAMATMDIAMAAGAAPTNFLDVGGSADQGRIEEALRLIVADQQVKVILINLFAGIARADVVAQGVVKAGEELGVKLPIVLRMRGTNAEEGKRILEQSGLDIHIAADLVEATSKLREILERVN